VTIEDVLDKLKFFDDNKDFDFEPVSHTYTYKGDRFISATQLISRFHKEFDTDYWAERKAKDTGVSIEEKKSEWQSINDRANFLGTSTHDWIENYFNKIWQPLPIDKEVIDRINKFNIIYADRLHKLTPVKFEQRIFSEKWKIAGMFDALFFHNGKFYILDWKTNKKFTTDKSDYGMSEKLLYPFGEYYKNHQTEYSIQLSLYKLILKQYGIIVEDCLLCYIGPNEPAKLYKTIDFSDILEKYLDENLLNN